MVAIGHATGLGVVIGSGLIVYALIHRPVGEESVFGARERMVVVLQDISFRERPPAEDTHLVNVSAEGAVGRRLIASA